jgi:hypothetical protein
MTLENIFEPLYVYLLSGVAYVRKLATLSRSSGVLSLRHV